MHSPETIQRFIELRAQGWSYSRLAAELGAAKTTLISWSRKHYRLIDNLRKLELEALAEKCQLTRRASIEYLGADLRRIREELAKRDLSQLPTAKLITLANILRTEIAKTNTPIQLTDDLKPGEPSIPEFTNPQLTWPG